MNKALDREAAVRDLLRAAALLRHMARCRDLLAAAQRLPDWLPEVQETRVLREMERRLLLLAEQLEAE